MILWHCRLSCLNGVRVTRRCDKCEDFEVCIFAGCAVRHFEEQMVGTEPEDDDEYADTDAEYDPESVYRVLPAEENLLDFLSEEDEE